MKIHTITHKSARRDGRPVKVYRIRYEETVRDPRTGAPTGQKRSRSETYPTHDAADQRRREIESERAGTGQVTGRDARLEPFATYAGAWLASLDVRVARGRLKPRTRAEYARILDTYLLPEFGATPIGALTPARADAFATALLAPPGRKPRSPATFQRIWHVFGRVCGYAVRQGAIPTSPLDRTEIDAAGSADAERFTPHPLTGGQVAAVADHIAARYPVYGLVVLFLAYTGLRAGELAGLQVGDFTGNTVRVERTKRRTGGEWIVGTPKSRKSRRTVPLDGWLAAALRDYLSTHPNADVPTAPLFPNRRKGGSPAPRPLDWDNPVEPGSLYSGLFQPACRAVGAPPARLHDLRHTFAVLSLSAGEHYMMVSKWLGHAKFSITLDVYGGYIPANEGGKAVPLPRPLAAAPEPGETVVPFRPRATG